MEHLPGIVWMKTDELALRTLQAVEGQSAVVVPGLVNQTIATLARLLPEQAATALSAAFSRRYRQR